MDNYYVHLDSECRSVLSRRDQLHQDGISSAARLRKRRSCCAQDPQIQTCGSSRRQKITLPLPTLTDEHTVQLDQLTKSIDWQSWTWGQFFSIDRAIIVTLFAHESYESVQEAIRKFAPYIKASWQEELDELWFQSSYRKLNKSGQAMSPVQTYRIRRKNPCPIARYCGERRYGINRNALPMLLEEFKNNPKPSKIGKERLADLTGLKFTTISNWFKNRRQRDKRARMITYQLMSTSQPPPDVKPVGTEEIPQTPNTWSSGSSSQVSLESDSSFFYPVFQQPKVKMENERSPSHSKLIIDEELMEEFGGFFQQEEYEYLKTTLDLPHYYL